MIRNLSLGILLTGLLTATNGYTATPWQEILSQKSESKVPEPRLKLQWLKHLKPAFELAQKENRPLFVTFRCLPCKQCAEFDKSVLNAGKELDPILRQFVTVRITNAEHLDLRIFPINGYQDLDLSWWGWFLSPKGQVYAIFGGKDHISDATRISAKALVATMNRVLSHHYHPDRPKWQIDGPEPDWTQKPRPTFQLPGFKSWAAKHAQGSGCLHCHQVAEILRQPALDNGTFDKKKDLDVWPLPENVGIRLDRDHGLKVLSVTEQSAAAKAGAKAGDILAAAGGRKLFGQTDFRGVLHRGPQSHGSIPLYWTRNGKVMHGNLDLKEGWRKTILDWRMSVSQGNIGASPGFFPLKASPALRRKLGIRPDVMAVRPFLGKKNRGPAWQAGLRNHHVITAVNGQEPDHSGRGFLVWFRLRFEPGATIKLSVKEPNGKSRELVYQTKK